MINNFEKLIFIIPIFFMAQLAIGPIMPLVIVGVILFLLSTILFIKNCLKLYFCSLKEDKNNYKYITERRETLRRATIYSIFIKQFLGFAMCNVEIDAQFQFSINIIPTLIFFVLDCIIYLCLIRNLIEKDKYNILKMFMYGIITAILLAVSLFLGNKLYIG